MLFEGEKTNDDWLTNLVASNNLFNGRKKTHKSPSG